MPQYLIEDIETGLKLQVAGAEPPSQTDAHELISHELDFLRTNLFQTRGNRFMLDVGPTGKGREAGDLLGRAQRLVAIMELVPEAAKRAHEQTKDMLWSEDYPEIASEILEDQIAKLAVERLGPEPAPEEGGKSTLQILRNVPSNSLLLISHGAEVGGLYTDQSHKFSLSNIASILGPGSNMVHNVINAACYGGQCTPEEFRAVFPNVTNLTQTPRDMLNRFSIERLRNSDFFWTDVTPNVWWRHGTNWSEPARPVTPTGLPLRDFSLE